MVVETAVDGIFTQLRVKATSRGRRTAVWKRVEMTNNHNQAPVSGRRKPVIHAACRFVRTGACLADSNFSLANNMFSNMAR